MRLWGRTRAQREAELDEEIRGHLAMAARDRIARGETPAAAAAAARREFGNVGLVREITREMWGGASIERLGQDVRYAVRVLRRAPSFTAAAVVALGLGIGANTAIFSVMNGTMLRPLPFNHPDRLAMIWMDNAKQDLHDDGTSIPTYDDWRATSRAFAAMAAYAGINRVYLTGGDDGEVTDVVRSTANLFSVLGVSPRIGRTFSADEVARGDRVVVLGYGVWQRRFGGRLDVVGSMIDVNGQPSRIIGVMPPGFYFPAKSVQLWEPITRLEVFDRFRLGTNRGFDEINVVGRLSPSASHGDAQREMEQIQARVAAAHPDDRGIRVVPLPLQATGRDFRSAVGMLLGAVGFLLLIACANVASLLLARGAMRARELSVRAALGAGRARLMRQLLTEGLALAAAGGIVGLGIAVVGVRGLIALAPPEIPRLDEISIDGYVLAFTVALTVLSGIVFGLVPAWKASSSDPHDTLRADSRAGERPMRTRVTGRTLIVVECALAVALLAGAGLLVRSFVARGVLLVHVGTPPSGVRRPSYVAQLRERFAAVRGVQAVGLISDNYGAGVLRAVTPERMYVDVEGQPRRESRTPLALPSVDPGFIRAAGVRLVRGRAFSPQDLPAVLPREFTADVVVVSQSFGREFFGDANPVGHRIKLGDSPNALWRTIVGVVQDIHRQGLDRAPTLEVFEMRNVGGGEWVIRGNGDPTALIPGLREAVREVAPGFAIASTETLEHQLASQTAERRFQTLLLTLFALVAVLLSAVGIYGVTHYLVAQRRHEIGVRIALGAQSSDVIALVVGGGVRFSIVGVAIGLLLAAALQRVISHLLFGVGPYDVATFAGVASLLIGVAVIACYLPARGATRVDPVRALRDD